MLKPRAKGVEIVKEKHWKRFACFLTAGFLSIICVTEVALAEFPAWPEEKEHVRLAAEQWEREKGNYRFWSYADKAAFCQQYGAYPYGTEDTITNWAMPTQGDTPYETALLTAKQAAVEYLGADAAKLDQLLLSTSYRRSFYTRSDGGISDAWVIQFCDTAGERYPLVDAVILSPSGDVLCVMERNVPAEMKGFVALKQWRSESAVSEAESALPDTWYYNPEGGKYYHYDANCPSVSSKFLPLTPFASVLWSMRPEYSVLDFCPYCVK